MDIYSKVTALQSYVKLFRSNKITLQGSKNPQDFATARCYLMFKCISSSKLCVFTTVLEQDYLAILDPYKETDIC